MDARDPVADAAAAERLRAALLVESWAVNVAKPPADGWRDQWHRGEAMARAGVLQNVAYAIRHGVAAALALLLLAMPAIAAEPGVTLTAITTAEANLTGDFGVRPSLDVRVDGPLAGLGSLRVTPRLRIFGQPGQAFSGGDVASFRAAELSLGVSQRVGRRKVGKQEVWTSLVVEAGLASVPSDEAYPRHYTAGFRIEERTSGMWLQVTGGRHEALGPWGKGQVLISGETPIPATRGIGILGGDVIASVGPGHHDWRLYMGASLGKAWEAMR